MIKKIICLLSIAFIFIFTLTGCGGFVQDESLVIQSITSEVLEDGTTMIVITYTDEEIQPAIFYIPKGEAGDDGLNGNGIKAITYELSEDGNYTNVNIEFTIEGAKIETVKIPNGISVSKITSEIDETSGNTLFTVHYSNGTKSDPIEVQRGEKGEKGTSLIGYEYTENEDGSQDIVFKYDNGDEYPVHIPAPVKGEKGDSGVGIAGVGSREDEEYYYIVIVYTEGEPTELRFPRPKEPNDWFYGNDRPSYSEGKDGDYFFDIVHNTIYVKVVDVWQEVIDFDDDSEDITVKFDLNDNDGYLNSENEKVEAKLDNQYKTQYTIPKGSYFANSGYAIPIPTREGFEFAGWYGSRTTNINSGVFTDLVPITSDITLYAKWVLIEE